MGVIRGLVCQTLTNPHIYLNIIITIFFYSDENYRRNSGDFASEEATKYPTIVADVLNSPLIVYPKTSESDLISNSYDNECMTNCSSAKLIVEK